MQLYTTLCEVVKLFYRISYVADFSTIHTVCQETRFCRQRLSKPVRASPKAESRLGPFWFTKVASSGKATTAVSRRVVPSIMVK